jgi:hypothetical protein
LRKFSLKRERGNRPGGKTGALTMTATIAIMLDKVEGVEDRGSSGLPTGQLLEP